MCDCYLGGDNVGLPPPGWQAGALTVAAGLASGPEGES